MTPAQTPVVFLNGGATGMFSAECVALLAKCGYAEEDFGSYDHVNARINAAKARVASLPPPPAPPAPDPHANDRRLAASTASHLTQDGVLRRPGKRGNVCASHADGYDGNLAPCMPMSAANEAVMGQHERDSIAGRGLSPGQVYPAPQLHQDSSERLRHVPGMGDNLAGTATAPPPAPGTSAPVAGAAPQPSPGASTPPQFTGTTAAECVESFRKAGFAAMLQNCKDNKAYNQHVASPQYKSDLEAKQRTQAAAVTTANSDAATARAAHDTANARLKAAQRANADTETLRPLYVAEATTRQARETTATAQRAAQADLNATNGTLAQLPGIQKNAQCRYDQAVALEGSSPRQDGVVP